MSDFSEKQDICKIARRIATKGYVAGTDGNLSILTDNNRILITASGSSMETLSDNQLVEVDFQGNKIAGDQSPSSEILMHLFIYQNRPEIKACCHAHPPFSTAFAVAGRALPANILPEVLIFIGKIALAPYAPPGTDAVPNSLREFVADHNAFLLRNHGLLTIGKNLEEAFFRMETVEHLAKIIYIAEHLGELNFLDEKEVKRLDSIRMKLQGNH